MTKKSSNLQSTALSAKTKENKWTKLQKEHPAMPSEEDMLHHWSEAESYSKQSFITKDNINPTHYKSGGIEAVDAMVSAFGREQVVKWAEVNAFKYIWRMHKKGPRNDNIEKAIWMLEFALGRDPRDKSS